MVMVTEVVPKLKRFLRPLPLSTAAHQMVMRVVVAFVLHAGRMSCLQAAGAVRSEPRHRAQVGRFLGRKRWRGAQINDQLRSQLLALESKRDGRWVFIVDATLRGQQGRKTENTYCTGNTRRRPKKGRRYGKHKRARKSCHSFTMGLLITPAGMRIPFQKPYRTREYCRKHNLTHRTSAESAADMVRELPVPDGTDVVVLGDTAYDAAVVRSACDDRDFVWIVPCNPERVLAGPKGKRPKVRSLLPRLSKVTPKTIRLAPGQGKYAVYRRLSPYRLGPKAKQRTYRVHEERRNVQSVGDCRLVFSTTKPNFKGATLDDVKILLTNARRLSVRDVVELYSLRWQIELFFKELKSTLGFSQYRFQQFDRVEGWTQPVLTTFLYLEWYRAAQLARRGLSDEEQRWWRHQRTHGLCQAVRQASEQAELKYIAERLETPGGLRKLQRKLRDSIPSHYQAKP